MWAPAPPGLSDRHPPAAAGAAPALPLPALSLLTGTCRGQAPLTVCDAILVAAKKTACRTAITTVNTALA